MTDAEKKLWWHLRRLRVEGTHFRRQAPIGPFFADFACHDRRLIVEVDGSQHGEPEALAADAQRSAFLKSLGYHVLRFWNNEVLNDMESVLMAIHAALSDAESAARTPHP